MSPGPVSFLREAFSLALVALAVATPAAAEKGKLRERLTPEVMAVVYPGAERLGPEEGSPPAIAVYKGDKVVAYIFSTLDIIAAPAYAPIPYRRDRRRRTRRPHHRRQGGVSSRALCLPRRRAPAPARHLPGARGGDAARRRLRPCCGRISSPGRPSAARLMRGRNPRHRAAGAGDAGRAPGRQRRRPSMPTASRLKSWDELIAEGAVVRLRMTSGEVAAALAKAACAADAALEVPLGKPDDLYIEVFFGLLTPAADRRQRDGRAQFRGPARPDPARRPDDLHGVQRAL